MNHSYITTTLVTSHEQADNITGNNYIKNDPCDIQYGRTLSMALIHFQLPNIS